MHPWTISELARYRLRDLDREAEAGRRAAEARRSSTGRRPGVHGRRPRGSPVWVLALALAAVVFAAAVVGQAAVFIAVAGIAVASARFGVDSREGMAATSRGGWKTSPAERAPGLVVVK